MTKLSPWTSSVFFLAMALMGTVAFGAQQQKVAVRVDGLACPFCAYGMEKKLDRLDGVEKMDIKINEGLVVLYFSEDARIDEALIEKKVKEAGFTPRQITVEEKTARVGGQSNEDGPDEKVEKEEKLRTISLAITGMECNECSHRVTEALSNIACVRNVRFDNAVGRAEITCVDDEADPEMFVKAIENLGFKASYRNESSR